VLFEGATQTSNFGSEPVFSDLAFRHRVHSLTYLTLVLTVVSGEQPMYEWQHDLSAYGSVHGWVDLRPLHPDKNNAKDTKDGKDGKDSKNSKNSNSDAPPQLNLSLEFQVHSGPLHLIMLRPYMSTADLQEVARQSKVSATLLLLFVCLKFLWFSFVLQGEDDFVADDGDAARLAVAHESAASRMGVVSETDAGMSAHHCLLRRARRPALWLSHGSVT
jgi:hypothetical protein